MSLPTVKIDPSTDGGRASRAVASAATNAHRLADVFAAQSCEVCQAYAARRGGTLLMWVAVYADRRGIDPQVLLPAYLGLVHRRHLEGGCLSTRPRTPDRKLPGGGKRIHVSRSCNGCQTDLGDVREGELDAAMTGGRLPDVRLECGCYDADAA